MLSTCRRAVCKVFVIAAVTCLSAACGPQAISTPAPPSATAPQPTSGTVVTRTRAPTLTSRPSPTRTATASPTRPSPTATQAGPPTPSVPLSAVGPWLVFAGEDGAYAANADGSGLRRLFGWTQAPDTGLVTSDVPNGGLLAYVLGSDWAHGLTLYIRSLPRGEIQDELPLTSPQTEPGSDDISDSTREAILALTDPQSLAWSPDGRRLAFSGMMDGPSADLYVYSTATGGVTRLSAGPSQGTRLAWSPDGRYVFHIGKEPVQGEGDLGIAGAWVARSDGSGVQQLSLSIMTSPPGDPYPLGWMSPDTVVVGNYDWAIWPEAYWDVWACDVRYGGCTLLWEEMLTDAAVDPASGAVMLAASGNVPIFGSHEQGLYLLRPGEGMRRLAEEPAYQVEWSAEADLFLVTAGESTLAVTPSGEIVQSVAGPLATNGIPLPLVPGSAPQALAWNDRDDGGVWIGCVPTCDEPIRRVFDREGLATWTPTGNSLFIVADSTLYLARPPDYVPVALGPGGSELGWVRP